MKNLIFCALVIICGSLTMQGQSLLLLSPENINEKPLRFKWTAGVTFGYDDATLIGDDTDGEDHFAGFFMGVSYEVSTAKKEALSYMASVTYSQQGYSFEDIDVRLNYINIPIQVGYEVIDGLTIRLGPQVGFNLNGTVKDGSNERDIDGIESIDVGVALGAQYHTKWNGVFFTADYILGLTDVFPDFAAQNANLRVGAGIYVFGNYSE
jgi:hypothetical protein